MIFYKGIEVKEPKDFDELYKADAFTIEGLDADSLGDMLAWLRDHAGLNRPVPNVYLIEGRDMNRNYKLTGSNAYPDDLLIVAVKLSSIKDVGKLAVARFDVGGRWFTDVVDNNKLRQKRK